MFRIDGMTSIIHAPLFSLTLTLGNEKWKDETISMDYDYELIQTRLSQLQTARELNDLAAISFLLRTSTTLLLILLKF